jgi:hypothetical protein
VPDRKRALQGLRTPINAQIGFLTDNMSN